ncbi:ead/Ea22-like family protein [Escherichia coli]|uniref:ead/Ea22-like family protein n=1 Tax=Escherichia coli TaxID=562 RepID=UPI0019322B05|nr:ead/Ea22-like family protein [Escherichia coli]MBL9254672.1 ead/Ea22-like family protein [Escherichia coli]
MSNIDKQALNEGQIEWLKKLADMEYCKSNPGHWLMSLKDTNMLAKLALRSVAMLDELEAAEKRIAELEGDAFNPAILDVVAERQRQQSVEGWTPEHDNAYQNSELADAAACYAIHAHNQGFSTPAHWPWSPDWWKQSGARRDLVKAGALILAEIERIDRAAGIGVKGE